jgi:hypothetical protein
MIEAKPKKLIGDRAYDSDPLDAELRKDGIPSRRPTQDRRRLSRYMRRLARRALLCLEGTSNNIRVRRFLLS